VPPHRLFLEKPQVNGRIEYLDPTPRLVHSPGQARRRVNGPFTLTGSAQVPIASGCPSPMTLRDRKVKVGRVSQTRSVRHAWSQLPGSCSPLELEQTDGPGSGKHNG
jgi:hypothetical protein